MRQYVRVLFVEFPSPAYYTPQTFWKEIIADENQFSLEIGLRYDFLYSLVLTSTSMRFATPCALRYPLGAPADLEKLFFETVHRLAAILELGTSVDSHCPISNQSTRIPTKSRVFAAVGSLGQRRRSTPLEQMQMDGLRCTTETPTGQTIRPTHNAASS